MNGKNGFSAIKHVANKHPYPTDAFLTEICCKKDGYSLKNYRTSFLYERKWSWYTHAGASTWVTGTYSMLGAYRYLPLLMYIYTCALIVTKPIMVHASWCLLLVLKYVPVPWNLPVLIYDTYVTLLADKANYPCWTADANILVPVPVIM